MLAAEEGPNQTKEDPERRLDQGESPDAFAGLLHNVSVFASLPDRPTCPLWLMQLQQCVADDATCNDMPQWNRT